MSGKAKIEGLTNAWYGFAVFSAATYLLKNGLGIFTLIIAGGSLLFSWFITFLIGRALINKSSLTRAFLILISGLFTVFGALAAAKTTWSFVTHWELSLLTSAFFTAVWTWMYGRSFRVLMDDSVKNYFR